jgi:uncharacterized protein (UPF0371 family)
MNVNPYLSPSKINSKYIKELNVRSKSMKLVETNIGKMLQDTEVGKVVFGYDPKAKQKKKPKTKKHQKQKTDT